MRLSGSGWDIGELMDFILAFALRSPEKTLLVLVRNPGILSATRSKRKVDADRRDRSIRDSEIGASYEATQPTRIG